MYKRLQKLLEGSLGDGKTRRLLRAMRKTNFANNKKNNAINAKLNKIFMKAEGRRGNKYPLEQLDSIEGRLKTGNYHPGHIIRPKAGYKTNKNSKWPKL